jgi:hypothetical protein
LRQPSLEPRRLVAEFLDEPQVHHWFIFLDQKLEVGDSLFPGSSNGPLEAIASPLEAIGLECRDQSL